MATTAHSSRELALIAALTRNRGELHASALERLLRLVRR